METLWRNFDGIPLFAITDQSAGAKWISEYRGALTISVVQNDLTLSVESNRSIAITTRLQPLAVSTFGRAANAIHDRCDELLYSQRQFEVVTLAFEMKTLDFAEIVFNTCVLMSPYPERESAWRGRLVVFGHDIDPELIEQIRLEFMKYRS